MRFCVLGSGSKGNCLLVQESNTSILIDCGFSQRKLIRLLEARDFDLNDLDAIFVTHEHTDHVGGVRSVAKGFNIPVYATSGSISASQRAFEGLVKVLELSSSGPVLIGDLEVAPVTVPHDAREPCQFIISGADQRLGLLTDIGHITPFVFERYKNLNGLVLEFNHDEDLMKNSSYPLALQERISGAYGHLSNIQSENFLRELDLSKLKYLVAGHLSQQTNSPNQVSQCLDRVLSSDVGRHIAGQEEASPWFDLSSG
jgi:phosphoribosyl 1,2-cyclic phosphodiesterase